MTTFAPGSVIRTRNRLWRVDGQPDDDVIVASTEVVGHIQSQDLLLRAYRLWRPVRSPHGGQTWD